MKHPEWNSFWFIDNWVGVLFFLCSGVLLALAYQSTVMGLWCMTVLKYHPKNGAMLIVEASRGVKYRVVKAGKGNRLSEEFL